MKILDKVQIGNTVRVNLQLSKDRLTKDTIEAIDNSSECIISDFKITDGKGIGLILKLSNGKEEWFFENEIEILDDKGNVIEIEGENENNYLMIDIFRNLNYKHKSKFNELINPINLMSWLIYSVKDIL